MDPLPVPLVAAITARLRERQTYGLAVCGFDRDGIVFAGGVGHADLSRGEEVTPDTVFRVASVSKLLTTTVALRLVAAGDLDLDEPLNRYLPEPQRVTDGEGQPSGSPLRTFLSHTSGLPFGVRGAEVGNRAVSYAANGGRVRNLADAVTGLRTVRPAGERIVYSNPGFNVVGFAAGQTAGTSFEDTADEQVLGPLGMASSRFTPHRVGPGVATPYGSIVPPGVSAEPADKMRLVATPMGGLTASVVDLARFGRMVLGRGTLDGTEFLPRELVDEATTLTSRNHPDLEQGYGLGFKARPWRGRTIVGHDGNMPGVATQLYLSPADGVGVVVLTNGFALGVPHEVAALALEQLLGLDPEPAPGSPSPLAEADRPEWEAVGRRIEGTYRLCDAAPAGAIGRLADAVLRVHVTHEVAGRLRVDHNAGWDGPIWLQPDGEVGRYRVAARVDSGTSAVVDEQPDGTHLWLGHTTHLHRR